MSISVIKMTKYQVTLLKPALRYLDSLPDKDRKRIVDALYELQDKPLHGSYKRLKGRAEWSLRVGNIRILFRVDKDKKHFIVNEIGPRGDVYK